ncbi:MAG TPA: hypothetical protein VMI54_30530 [Polyangiaceae bacterium]|nr:hypothetical protein [Polyangiaceae bacterium]
MRLVLGAALVAAVELASPAPAHATEAEQVTLEEDSSAQAPKPKPEPASEDEPKVKRNVARYSLPWELRPVLPVNLARLDNTFAFYGVGGTTIVEQASASYKVIQRLAILAKLTVANDAPPNGPGAFGFANPLIGAQAGFWPAKSLKLGLFLGFTLPVGMGGGAPADPGQVEAIHAAMLARSGFDNPLFMPDYLTTWPGIDIAYVTHGFTVQAETSVALMGRVRGPYNERNANADFTLGLHAGYFIFPWWSAGLDLRYERWLTTPAFINAENDPSGDLRDVATAEVGARFHVKVTDDITWRPGLSMAFGIDDPMAGASYKVVHVDLPFQF